MQARTAWRFAFTSCALTLGTLAGCAGATSNFKDTTSPTQQAKRAYPGPCSGVELDVVEMSPPGRSAGLPNLGENSLEVVATLRPGEHIDDPREVVSFREQRQRVDDLQAQLRQQTFVACEPASKVGDRERLPPPPAAPSSSENSPVAPAPKVAPRTR